MTSLSLKHIKRLKGQVRVLTGLHIGGARESIEIGGMDNPVIKNPVTGEPYIPGSSLKGKMRSMLEVALNKIMIDSKGNGIVHDKCGENGCPVCRVFGNTDDKVSYGPTRIIVRDAVLNKPKTCENLRLDDDDFPVTQIIEEKTENMIDRIRGKAINPRPQERVVPGSVFDFEILYKVYDVEGDGGATDEDLFRYVKLAMDMIELDYIGGNGTRGCGQIRFEAREPEILQPQSMLAQGK